MDNLQLIKNKIYFERKTENGTPNGEALTDQREVTLGSPTEWEVKRKTENGEFPFNNKNEVAPDTYLGRIS